jgi:hypothetical protein
MSRVHNPRVIEELRDRIGRLEVSAAKQAIVLPFGVARWTSRLWRKSNPALDVVDQAKVALGERGAT